MKLFRSNSRVSGLVRSDSGPLARLVLQRSRWSPRVWGGLVLLLAAGMLWDAVGFSHREARADDEPHAEHAVDPDAQDPAAAHDEDHAGHESPVAPVLAGIVIILLMAKIAGDLFERMGMPAVLGELCIGILLGNVALITGWFGQEHHEFDFLHAPPEINVAQELKNFEEELEAAEVDPATHIQRVTELRQQISEVDPYSAGAILKMLAEIGVVLLLFEVGLESNVRDMLSVGVSSMIVAILGVVAPMALGYGVGVLLLPEEGWQVHVFLGATLCATSVGITARVLKDLGRSQQRESRIILGAAVIDDVLGLIVLAVVKGVIEQGAEFEPMSLVWIILKAVGFLFGAILLGANLFTKPMFRAATALSGHGLLVVTSLVICFGLAWLANFMGLAPIVGAFAAGLILERTHYQELGHREDAELEEALLPLTAVLVPIFFVDMGIMVDLSSFADPSLWGVAAALTAAAIIGKQICSLGVVEKGLNRFAVGLGMIPRGEVGLIFASVGMGLTVIENGERVPVIVKSTYSAVVVMVILTTMITPPLLKWSLGRRQTPDSVAPGASEAPSQAT
ncbi:MAG: cation:proton antiporter [Planctomycetota bacterium]|nr:MAG: cation:proton antiporter [Planctomycetota bacterium]